MPPNTLDLFNISLARYNPIAFAIINSDLKLLMNLYLIKFNKMQSYLRIVADSSEEQNSILGKYSRWGLEA